MKCQIVSFKNYKNYVTPPILFYILNLMYTGCATIGVLQNKRKAQFNLEAENAEMALWKKLMMDKASGFPRKSYLYVGPITKGMTNCNSTLIIHLMYSQGKYKYKQKYKWIYQI